MSKFKNYIRAACIGVAILTFAIAINALEDRRVRRDEQSPERKANGAPQSKRFGNNDALSDRQVHSVLQRILQDRKALIEGQNLVTTSKGGTKLNVSLAVIGSLVVPSPCHSQVRRGGPRLTKTTAILIRPSLMRTSEAIKQRANIPPYHAIYITEPDEIRAVTQALTLRRGPYWACGYDWDMEFFVTPKQRVRASVKEDCRALLFKGKSYVFEGRFARHLRSLVKRLKMRPSHYILDAQIPAQTEPEEALAKLGEAGLTAYISESLPNKPWLRVKFTVKTSAPNENRRRSLMKAAEVRAKAQAKEKLRRFIEKAKATGRLEDVSEIRDAGSGTYDNKTENTQEVTLHFKTGTPRDYIASLAATENVEVVEARIPEFYFIQILSAEVPSQESMAKLRRQAMLIQGLSPFPSGQRSLR